MRICARASSETFVDKTGVVAKAEKHVRDFLERQRLTKLMEEIIQKIKNARRNENADEMEYFLRGQVLNYCSRGNPK